MKNIVVLILFILLWSYPTIAQNSCEQDTVMYIAAYNYIVSDSVNQNKKIVVSDSIIDLDRFWFSQDLDKFPDEKEKLNQHREDKGFKWFEPYYSHCIDSLFCKQNQQAKNILFFSQVEDNMLRADLLFCKRYTDKFNYDTIAFQTVGQTYLFIFNKDGTIRVAFSRKLIYD